MPLDQQRLAGLRQSYPRPAPSLVPQNWADLFQEVITGLGVRDVRAEVTKDNFRYLFVAIKTFLEHRTPSIHHAT